MPARMCGASRTRGAIYVSAPLSEFGAPLEHFLVDPPIPVDLAVLGISALGMTLIDRGETTYLFDVVGSEHYPNVADFLEEVRRLGLSRKISRRTDFSRITARTKIVLIHRRAMIRNAEEYQRQRVRRTTTVMPLTSRNWCPQHHAHHEDGRCLTMCAGLWWEDIEGGVPMPRSAADTRSVYRDLPCCTYDAWAAPLGVVPEYQYAIFAAFPVAQLDVIRDDDGGSMAAFDRAQVAGVPVIVVEE